MYEMSDPGALVTVALYVLIAVLVTVGMVRWAMNSAANVAKNEVLNGIERLSDAIDEIDAKKRECRRKGPR